MKKLLAISVLSLLLANTATNTTGTHRGAMAKPIEVYVEQAIQTKPIEDYRADKILARLNELYPFVGETPYVFSGSKPSGWDCSGLVMWFYSGLGVKLPHSAKEQATAGKRVKDPLIGDIVSFGSPSYHSGIYVGNGFMIHAPRQGKRTELILIKDFVANEEGVRFIRINF